MTASGAMQQWDISSQQNKIIITYGQVGGIMQTQTEVVPLGLAGRTLEQQVTSRINSRVNKQLDKGYRYTIEDAKKLSNMNALDLLKPMLAQSSKKLKHIDHREYWAQFKYDGHRCLITKLGGKLRAYSRQGKWITTIDHILEGMDIPEGWTIDGELYHHGTSLQTISSWAKRKQENTLKLKFIAYDLIMGINYRERYSFLKNDFVYGENVVVAPTGTIKESIIESLGKAKGLGYEGLILRHKNYVYEAGKRSRGLLKVKEAREVPYIEKEFTVVDVHPSKDNWAILECAVSEGKTFRTSAPGTMVDKTFVLQNKDNYIGKVVTVEFPNYTDDGKPFHATAMRWRDDL